MRSINPPIEHLTALIQSRSLLLLKNLLRVVSILQKKAAIITSSVPNVCVTEKLFTSPLVARNIVPMSRRIKPTPSLFWKLLLENKNPYDYYEEYLGIH